MERLTEGYVEWRLSCSASMFCNYQTYFCSRTKNSSPNEVLTEAHLEQAIENLDQINIIGTVERYAQWLALAESVLQETIPDLTLAVARKNVTNPATELSHAAIFEGLMADLGSKLAERLLQCNQFDMRLHQIADALLTRHLAERRVDVTLFNTYTAVSGRLTSAAAKEPSAID